MMKARARRRALQGTRRREPGAVRLDRAFTLIEMLAVVALAAMVVAIMSAALPAASSWSDDRDAASIALHMDRAARSIAMREGRTVALERINERINARINARIDEPSTALAVGDGSDKGEPVGQEIWLSEPLPAGVTATWMLDGTEATRLIVDSQGRTADYQLIVSGGSGTRRWLICGLTAAAIELKESP